MQPVTLSGQHAQVKADIPLGWRSMMPSAERVEYLAPDGRSRIYLRAMTSNVEEKHCPKVAREYAREYIGSWGGPPRTRVTSKVANGPQVDFELHRTEPAPEGEVIRARVLCRGGALVVIACIVPSARAEDAREGCATLLDSLRIETSPGKPGV